MANVMEPQERFAVGEEGLTRMAVTGAFDVLPACSLPLRGASPSGTSALPAANATLLGEGRVPLVPARVRPA